MGVIDVDMVKRVFWVSVWEMDEFDDHSFSLATDNGFRIDLKVIVYLYCVALAFAFSSPKSVSYRAFYPSPTCVVVLFDPIVYLGLFQYYWMSVVPAARVNSDHERLYSG